MAGGVPFVVIDFIIFLKILFLIFFFSAEQLAYCKDQPVRGPGSVRFCGLRGSEGNREFDMNKALTF